MNTETLTYSRSKGVFAGLTLEGAVVQQDDDSTIAIYNKKVPFRRVLSGKIAAPQMRAEFDQAVAAASHQARGGKTKASQRSQRLGPVQAPLGRGILVLAVPVTFIPKQIADAKRIPSWMGILCSCKEKEFSHSLRGTSAVKVTCCESPCKVASLAPTEPVNVPVFHGDPLKVPSW